MFFNRKVELVDTSGLHGLSLGFDLDPKSLYTYLDNVSKGNTDGLPPPAVCDVIKALLDVKQPPTRRRPRRPRAIQNYNRNPDKIGTMTKEAMTELLETTSGLLKMRVSRRKGLALVVIAELGVNLSYLENHLSWPTLRALLWPLEGTEPPPGATTKVFNREWTETDHEVGALQYHRWVLRALECGTVSPILLMPRTPTINPSTTTTTHTHDTPEPLSLTRVLGLDMPEMPTPPATPQHIRAHDELRLGLEGIVGIGGITPLGSPESSDVESDSGGHDSDTDEVWVGTGGRVFEDAEEDETEAAVLAREQLLSGASPMDLDAAHHTPDINTLDNVSSDTHPVLEEASVRRVADFVDKYIGMSPHMVKVGSTESAEGTINEEEQSDVLVPLWPGSSHKVSAKVVCIQLLYELGRFHTFRNNYQKAYECFARLVSLWGAVCALPEEADDNHRIITFTIHDATNWMRAVKYMLQETDHPSANEVEITRVSSQQSADDESARAVEDKIGLQGRTALQIFAQQYKDVEEVLVEDTLTDELSDAFRYSVQFESHSWAEVDGTNDKGHGAEPSKSVANEKDAGIRKYPEISWSWRLRILNAIKGALYNRTTDPAVFDHMDEAQCKAATAYFLAICDQLRTRYHTQARVKADGVPTNWTVCRQRLCRLAQMAHFCTKDMRNWMEKIDPTINADVTDRIILGVPKHSTHTKKTSDASKPPTKAPHEDIGMGVRAISSDTTAQPKTDIKHANDLVSTGIGEQPEHAMAEMDAVTAVFCTDAWEDFVKTSELSRALNFELGDGDESWITGDLPQKMLANDPFAREGMGRLSHSDVLHLGLPSKLSWHHEAQAYTYTGVDYSMLDSVDHTGQVARKANVRVGGGPWGGGGGGCEGSVAMATTQQLERDVGEVAKHLERMLKQILLNEQGATIDRKAVMAQLSDVYLVREGMIRACVSWRRRCYDNAEKFLRGVSSCVEDLSVRMRERVQGKSPDELVVPLLKALKDCSQRTSWHIVTVLADKVNSEAQEMFKVGYELSDQSESADALIKELEVCTSEMADTKVSACMTQPQVLSLLCALANVGLSPACGLWETIMPFVAMATRTETGAKRRHPDEHLTTPRDRPGVARQLSSTNDNSESTAGSTASSIYKQAPHSANNYLKFICNLAGRVSSDSDVDMDDDDDTRTKDIPESTEEQRTEMRDDFELFLLQLATDVDNSPHTHETKPSPTPTATTHLPLLAQVMRRLHRKDLVLSCIAGLALALDLVSPVQRNTSGASETTAHVDSQSSARGSKSKPTATTTEPSTTSDKTTKQPHFKCINTPTTGPRHDLNKVLKDGGAVVADSAAQAGRGIRLSALGATGAVATMDLKKNATHFFNTLGAREPAINNDHWDDSITSACVDILQPRAGVELKRGDPTLTMCLADIRYHCGLYRETLRLYLQMGVTVTDFFGSVGPLKSVWNQLSLRKMVHSLVNMRAFIEAAVLAQLITEKGNVTRQAAVRMAYAPPISIPTPYTDIDTHTQRNTVAAEGYAVGVPVIPTVNEKYFHYFWDQTTMEILLCMCAERNVADHQRLAAQLYSDRGSNWCNVAEVQKAWALDRQKKFLIELAHDFMP